jgi:hypothetical protein
MDYISPSWPDIPELVVPAMMSMMESCSQQWSHWTKDCYWLSWSHHLQIVMVATMIWLAAPMWSDGRIHNSIFSSFITCHFPAAVVYGLNISQLTRYSRACCSCHDVNDGELLSTMKPLNQGLLLVKLKSSPSNCYGRHHDLISSSMWSDGRIHNSIFSSFITCH